MIVTEESDREGSADRKPPGTTGASGKNIALNDSSRNSQEEIMKHPP